MIMIPINYGIDQKGVETVMYFDFMRMTHCNVNIKYDWSNCGVIHFRFYPDLSVE